MAIELFLVPMVGAGTKDDPYRAKYTRDPQVIRSGAVRYSRTESAVALIEAPATYLTEVRGQSDVVSLATPSNIDNALTANQANAAKDLFEDRGIPAGFINAGDTRREAIRAVIGLFLFSQRLEGRYGSGFWDRAKSHGITLATVWADFPQSLKDEFLDVRDSFGWTGNLGVTNSTTLREVMRILAEQFEDTPMYIAGVAI